MTLARNWSFDVTNTAGTTGQIATGIGNAASSAISAAGQIATTTIQYQTAKAMLASQGRIANREFNFEMQRFDNADAITASIENIQKFKNEAMIGNAEAHRDKALAEARITEQKKTREAGRVKNKEVLGRVLGKRGSAFYGTPVAAT